jgi:hypothetical protein
MGFSLKVSLNLACYNTGLDQPDINYLILNQFHQLIHTASVEIGTYDVQMNWTEDGWM